MCRLCDVKPKKDSEGVVSYCSAAMNSSSLTQPMLILQTFWILHLICLKYLQSNVILFSFKMDIGKNKPKAMNYMSTRYLLESSAEILCRHSGPRSDPTECRDWSESKLFGSMMVFLKGFLKKSILKKRAITKHEHFGILDNIGINLDCADTCAG